MLSCLQQTLLRSLTSPMFPKITQCGFFHFTCLSNVRQAGYSYITPWRSLLPSTLQKSNSTIGRAPRFSFMAGAGGVRATSARQFFFRKVGGGGRKATFLVSCHTLLALMAETRKLTKIIHTMHITIHTHTPLFFDCMYWHSRRTYHHCYNLKFHVPNTKLLQPQPTK